MVHSSHLFVAPRTAPLETPLRRLFVNRWRLHFHNVRQCRRHHTVRLASPVRHLRGALLAQMTQHACGGSIHWWWEVIEQQRILLPGTPTTAAHVSQQPAGGARPHEGVTNQSTGQPGMANLWDTTNVPGLASASSLAASLATLHSHKPGSRLVTCIAQHTPRTAASRA